MTKETEITTKKKKETIEIELNVPYSVTISGIGTVNPSERIEITQKEYEEKFLNTHLFKIIKDK